MEFLQKTPTEITEARPGALAGIRVIDLTHYIAGPYCTKLMAGFGAEVIKVERPGRGDGLRQCGPFPRNARKGADGLPFLWLNTGKKSFTVDLKTDEGKEILRQMARDADVVIENFSPGVMASLGFSYEALREINPGIVMTSITNFGQTGPYRDFKADEMGLQAMSGIMFMTGQADKPPLLSAPAICQYTAGQHAYVATLMALFQRRRTGTGHFVDISIQESALEHIEIALSYNLQQGRTPKRGGHTFVPWGTYPSRDGYATVVAMPYRHWHRARDLFEDERLFDARFDTLQGRLQHREEYEGLLKSLILRQDARALFLRGQERGLSFGYVASLNEALHSPQHEARGFFVETRHPEAGRLRHCGAPFAMATTPWLNGRAPLLGEHNPEIFRDVLGLSEETLVRWQQEGII